MINRTTSTWTYCALLLVPALLGCCDAFLAVSSLTPQTTPEAIVMAQLGALKRYDIQTVFDFVSIENREEVNYDVKTFGEKAQDYAYSPLLEHQEAELLLTTQTPQQEWKGLVRVVPSRLTKEGNTEAEDAPIALGSCAREYWWTLSRSENGPHKGCFLVDAIVPNM